MTAVGLVVVSHSRALGEAAAELGREVLQGGQVRVEVAAGLDDGALGTDATAVLGALQRADSGDGVVVLMDLGSAVLSAELALELLDDDARARVVLSPAPLVEGLVAACVAAAGGADRAAVAAEAGAGLAGKQAHLGEAAPDVAPVPERTDDDGDGTVVRRTVVTTPYGLHARPAARLVQAARAAEAQVEVRNATTGLRLGDRDEPGPGDRPLRAAGPRARAAGVRPGCPGGARRAHRARPGRERAGRLTGAGRSR